MTIAQSGPYGEDHDGPDRDRAGVPRGRGLLPGSVGILRAAAGVPARRRGADAGLRARLARHALRASAGRAGRSPAGPGHEPVAGRAPVAAERGPGRGDAHAARRPAGSHPAAPPGAEGVHAAPGGAAAAAHRADRRGPGGRAGGGRRESSTCSPPTPVRCRSPCSASCSASRWRTARGSRRLSSAYDAARGDAARWRGAGRLLHWADRGQASRTRRRPAVGADHRQRPGATRRRTG